MSSVEVGVAITGCSRTLSEVYMCVCVCVCVCMCVCVCVCVCTCVQVTIVILPIMISCLVTFSLQL